MKIKSILLILTAGLFFIFSCAEPIDRSLIQVAEDTFPPEVVEISPVDNSLYYSIVVVEGIVEDNSLFGGDGEGRLVSISYTLSNNYNRRGKITINEDGTIEAVSDFGNGEILYDSETGQFSFTFSTIEFDRDGTPVPDIITGYMTINVDFEDANENIVTEQINLRENDEPYLNLVEPGTLTVNYEADDNIEVYGNVANSSQDIDENDEIVSIEWLLTMMPNWRQKIDLSVLTPEADGHYEVQSTEDAIGIPLFRYYPDGVTGTSLPGNPEDDGYFYTLFVAPAIVGNLSFRFDVVDKRGGEFSESVDIASKLLSPVFSNLSFSGIGVHYNSTELKYYYSSAPGILSPGDVIFNGKLSDNGPVPEIKYKIRTNSVWLSEEIGKGTATNDGEIFSFSLDITDLQTSPGNYSQVRIEANNGDGTGYGTKIIYDDNLPPNITINNFSSNNSNNTTYAKLGDTITLSFNVADVGGVDAVSGLDGAPVVTIANHPITSVDNGNGNWTATYIMGTSSDVGINNNYIPYSISILDNVNNEGTAASGGNEIMYYEGIPNITSIVASTDSPTTENPEWIKASENIKISYSVDRDLLNTPVVTVSGLTTTTTGIPVPDFESEYIMAVTDSDDSGNGVELSYSITVTDRAGNSKNSTGSTNIWFDKTSPSAPNGLSSTVLSGSYISGVINNFDIDVDMTGSGAKTGDTIELLLDSSAFGSGYDDLLLVGELSAYEFSTVNRSDLGSDGSKSFTARVIDLAGNTGAPSAAFVKSLDTAPPSITINTYVPNTADNSRIRQTGIDTITISTTITDTNGLDPANKPTLKMGAEAAVEMTDSGGGTWVKSWTISSNAVEDVNFLVQVTAVDLVGNSVTETGRTFIPDNFAPTSTVPTGFSYNDPNVTFTVPNINEGSDSVKVNYDISSSGGGSLSTTVTGLLDSSSGSVSVTVDISELTDGTITLNSIQLEDALGNTGSLTGSGLNDTKDTTAPTSNNPTGFSYSAPNVTFTVPGITEVSDSVKVNYNITSSGGGSLSTTVIGLLDSSSGSVSVTVDISELTDGTITLNSIQLEDALGNTGSLTGSGLNDTKDTTAPTSNNPTGFSYSAPNVTFTVPGITEVSDSVKVNYNITSSGGGSLSTTVTGLLDSSSGSVSVSVDIFELTDGIITLNSIQLEDALGNTGSSTSSGLTTSNDFTAPTSTVPTGLSYSAPNVTFTVPNITEVSGSVKVNYDISSSGGGSLSTTVTGLLDSSSGSVSVTVDISELTDGIITLNSIQLEDASSNTGSSTSSGLTTSNDSTAPTSTVPTGFSYSAPNVTFTVPNITEASGSVKVNYDISSSGGGSLSTTVTGLLDSSSGSVSVTVDISDLTDGIITLNSIQLEDASSNTGSSTSSGLTTSNDSTAPTSSVPTGFSYSAPNVTFSVPGITEASGSVKVNYNITSSGGGSLSTTVC